jgi:hypothetical protein
MIGCAEFIGAYDFTFEYLRRTFGEDALRCYWETAVSVDSQRHARELIIPGGFEGMEEYWGHTLAEEEAGYVAVRTEDAYRIDMHACPSLGYLLERGEPLYHDYCGHCLGWIKPVMDEAGFVIFTEHNSRGQCYWEMRRAHENATVSAPGEITGDRDVRRREDW